MAYPTSGSTTTYVGTENIGDVVTKANLDTTPGGLVAYAQITANASAQTAGFSGVTGLSVTCPATAGRFYKITAGAAGFLLAGTGTATCDFTIYDQTATTDLASIIACAALGVAFNAPGQRIVAYSQPGGVHNYIVANDVVANSGSPSVATAAAASGSAARTAYIFCEDVGATF